MDSIRYTRLQEISARSLQESIKQLTLDRVSSCYPTIASTPKGRQALQQAINQIVAYWQSTATKEFTEIYKERDIQTKMNELDNIIAEAVARRDSDDLQGTEKPVVLSKLTPSQVVDSHLRPVLQQQISELEQELSEKKEQNSELIKQILSSKEMLRQVEQDLNKIYDNLNKATAATATLPDRSTLSEVIQ